ncbi:MAG: SDR family NAD(P)-dependent oxidoreductase [Synergistaceae bacterium]|jgi:3-oxoacyl-[acyl-carrier protein] reductase|nr:SDR family NAD(P)-dependent oxidoreductase [Synergistaceae bacterium]
MVAAFVTNGTGKFSRELCRLLARRGFSVSFTYGGPEEEARAIEGELRALGAVSICLPVKDFSAPELSGAVIETAERLGGIDSLFYVFGHRDEEGEDDKMLLDLDYVEWDSVMAGGERGFFLSCKYALPYLVSSARARVWALDAFQYGASSQNLAEYVSSLSIENMVAFISRELSNYGVPALYRRISEDENWASGIMEESGFPPLRR